MRADVAGPWNGSDRVIVTLFINAKQFNRQADLTAHPRTEDEDAAKLAPLGAHLLYAPDGIEIYLEGLATTVAVNGVSEGLCGAFRPRLEQLCSDPIYPGFKKHAGRRQFIACPCSAVP
ncbi:pantoate--beta-alanine ligase (plasmid) [Mesorhizobium sp. AR07]|nr:pantoate--beta-alanine ligase [Mesorhizobium sp. AR07]